ncbi:glycosyltransferase [Rhodococcus sp. CH91]|uniref:glycosyltransferase n=1 Tax=Rhodococcus sp. CH91 TaxID=2910256 RepID=UPI001F4A16FB|nr:glycosyltransferase [Rhodococcus sp. CH91]
MNTSIEKKAIRLLQLMRCRTAIVVHNPVKGRDEIETQPEIAMIRRNATVLIVHDEDLARGLRSYRNVVVAAHPAYFAWADATTRAEVDERAHNVALFLGSARPDKGFDQLPEIAHELAAEGYSLRCAIGRLTVVQESTLTEAPNIEVLYGADGHISNQDMRDAIDGSTVLIAPYSNVTASGTILMAMSVGLPVVAYHNDGLEELIGPNRLANPATAKNLVQCVTRTSNSDSQEVLRKMRLHDERARIEWTAAIESLLSYVSARGEKSKKARNRRVA